MIRNDGDRQACECQKPKIQNAAAMQSEREVQPMLRRQSTTGAP